MLHQLQPERVSVISEFLGWPFALILLEPCNSQNFGQGLEINIRQAAQKLGAPLPSSGIEANKLLRLLWHRGGFQDLRSLVTTPFPFGPREVGVAVRGVFGRFYPPRLPESLPCWDKFLAQCQWLKNHSSKAAFSELVL